MDPMIIINWRIAPEENRNHFSLARLCGSLVRPSG
jgi:hypothetical protein